MEVNFRLITDIRARSQLKSMTLLDRLALQLPIIQAPMAEVSTPELAAAVSNAGALGSIGVGATNASGAARMLDEFPRLTDAAFNVNIFVHKTPRRDDDREASTLKVTRGPASTASNHKLQQ